MKNPTANLDFPVVKNIPLIKVNPPIKYLLLDECELSIDDAIKKGKAYIKTGTLELWKSFCSEYKYFYSSLFIKRLVNILILLNDGLSLEEIEEYLNELPLHKELINYISIALIKFSDRGYEFYEKFYNLENSINKSVIIDESETIMCRKLIKKDTNN